MGVSTVRDLVARECTAGSQRRFFLRSEASECRKKTTRSRTSGSTAQGIRMSEPEPERERGSERGSERGAEGERRDGECVKKVRQGECAPIASLYSLARAWLPCLA